MLNWRPHEKIKALLRKTKNQPKFNIRCLSSQPFNKGLSIDSKVSYKRKGEGKVLNKVIMAI